MAGKKFLHTDEVAEILSCSVDEVCARLKEGSLQGHKTSRGRWLINKDQLGLSSKSSHTNNSIIQKPSVSLRKLQMPVMDYIKDEEHEEKLYNLFLKAKKSIYIATANFKNMYLHDRQFIDILDEKSKQGVDIRVICAKPVSVTGRFLEEHPSIMYQDCRRNHMKMYMFDEKMVYLGSANITQAASGNRSENTRNFEAGVLTNNENIVSQALKHFESVWEGDYCKKCKKEDCPGRII